MERTEQVKNKDSKTFLVALTCTIMVAAFPPMFLYFRNAGEAHFRDVAAVLMVFVLTGIVLFGISLLVTKNAGRAGVIASLFLLVFLNYTPIEGLIQKIAPDLRYWHIAPILFVLLLHLAWFIWKKAPDDLCKIITPVVCVVFAVLILINGVTAIPAINTRRNAEREARRQAEMTITTEYTLPNFYFILFDEFSTIPFMQKYYDYDNSKLLIDLENIGFNTSQTGHNESNATSVVTADLFQLNYDAVSKSSEEEWFTLRTNNNVFPQLREKGYTIICPAEADFYGLPNALNDNTAGKAKTLDGEDVKTILIKRSVINPFMFDASDYIDTAKVLLEQLSFLKNPNSFKSSNQFVLAHINLPHEPFYFNADGSMADSPSNDWTNPEPYLNQYRFASDQIYSIAQNLVANDPNSVIWILSDHSARAASNLDLYLKIFPMEDMTNFFSAVYFQGRSINVEGLSGVNTFRLLLNELIGTSYEMIPLPSELR